MTGGLQLCWETLAGGTAPAALYAIVSGIIGHARREKYPPGQMLELVNKTITSRRSRANSALSTRLRPSDARVVLANPGLPYPLLIHANAPDSLELAGIPSDFPRLSIPGTRSPARVR